MEGLETEDRDPQNNNEYLKVKLLFISKCSEYFLMQT